MARLHLYLPDDTAKLLREKAQREGLSVSAWPERYFGDVIGAWQGDLERPEQPELERRDAW